MSEAEDVVISEVPRTVSVKVEEGKEKIRSVYIFIRSKCIEKLYKGYI